jgi:dihydroxy-acid dehydratase
MKRVTMGTASTMACIAEAMGMTLPMASSIPSVVSEHSRLAVTTGRRAVEMAWEKLVPSRLISQASFINAVITQLAIGGSTNAIVHIIAMAGRAGCRITLEDFDHWSKKVPVLADLRPAGRFLMEDFYNAGGLGALLNGLQDLIDGSCQTVSGKTLGEQIAQHELIDEQVIRSRQNPISASGGTYVLRGNLAPSGCVIKPVAAEPRLLKHRGKAVVFENYAELKAKIAAMPVKEETGKKSKYVTVVRKTLIAACSPPETPAPPVDNAAAFDNVDVYPLLAHLLDVKPAANDGDLSSTAAALK